MEDILFYPVMIILHGFFRGLTHLSVTPLYLRGMFTRAITLQMRSIAGNHNLMDTLLDTLLDVSIIGNGSPKASIILPTMFVDTVKAYSLGLGQTGYGRDSICLRIYAIKKKKAVRRAVAGWISASEF